MLTEVPTMASDGEISCTNDPNFAVIYSFLKVFGKLYGLEIPTIAKLQEFIENTEEGNCFYYLSHK
jgi:remodeling and spacing factor 1